MGGFSILSREFAARDPEAVATYLKVSRLGGLAEPIAIPHDRYNVHYFPKHRQGGEPQLLRFPNGDFILCSGTLFHRGLSGQRALAAVFSEFDGSRAVTSTCRGSFALVICREGSISVFNDALGVYPIFYDQRFRAISSGFLPMAMALPSLTLNRQSVYEYVFNGVVSGNASMVDEIALLPVSSTLVLDRTPTVDRRSLTPPTEPESITATEAVKSIRDILIPYFEAIASRFGNQVTCALSGGYDSRLLTAFLRAAGVDPDLYVYGADTDDDVRLARQIASQQNLKLKVIDKSLPRIQSPNAFSQVVDNNFFVLDGYGWEGLFDNGEEAAQRQARVANGSLALNGGAGEIMRNFFYLQNRHYSGRELLWSFYSRFDPQACTTAFDEEDYYRNLEDKLDELVGSDLRRLPRPTIDWLYHLFRCRSWDGRANAVNGKFGHTALPFLDSAVTQFASRIPPPLKDHGAFQAALIADIDPILASYPSNYGHSFDQAPPFRRRVTDVMTYMRPPALRRFSFRLQQRMRRTPKLPTLLRQSYIGAVLPGDFAFMRQFFRFEAVRDSQQMARILSVEYLARRLGSRLRVDLPVRS